MPGATRRAGAAHPAVRACMRQPATGACICLPCAVRVVAVKDVWLQHSCSQAAPIAACLLTSTLDMDMDFSITDMDPNFNIVDIDLGSIVMVLDLDFSITDLDLGLDLDPSMPDLWIRLHTKMPACTPPVKSSTEETPPHAI